MADSSSLLLDDSDPLVTAAASRSLIVLSGGLVYRFAQAETWIDTLQAPLPQGPHSEQPAPIDTAGEIARIGGPERQRFESYLRQLLDDASKRYSVVAAWVKALEPLAVMDVTHGCLYRRTLERLPPSAARVAVPGGTGEGDAILVAKPLGDILSDHALPLSLTPQEAADGAAALDLDAILNLPVTPTVLVLGDDRSDPLYRAATEVLLQRIHLAGASVVVATSSAEDATWLGIPIRFVRLGDGPEENIGDEVAKLLGAIYAARDNADVAVREPVDGRSDLLLNGGEILNRRLATGLSLQVRDDYVDRHHRYTLLWRQDLLDYPTGDFYSVRRISGVNVSEELSSGIVYCESSEQKISFEQTAVVGLDVATRQQLEIVPLASQTEIAFTHPFFIRFPTPIMPGGSFDILYAISLPGELQVLRKDSEIMSVSLARIKHGVEKLVFNVVLDFEPAWVEARCMSKTGEQIACDGSRPVLEEFRPRQWFEEHFDIGWTGSAHIVRWSIDEPDSKLYIIHYKR
jgi:hypothetical protein